MLSVEQPAVVLLAQSLVKRISDVANAARNAVVDQDIFIQLACYLERIVPICIELQRGRDSSPMIREILEALMRNIDSVDELIRECSNKSRIYLVTHSRSVAQQLEHAVHDLGRSLCLIPLSSVQGQEDTKAVIDSLSRDMQQAHFEVNKSDDRICQLLSQDSMMLQRDPHLQTGLLLDIARSVGIEDAPRNPTALKLQVELLRNDLQGATEAYDLQMMDLLGNMVENWAQGADSVSTLDGGMSQSQHREQKRVDPLYESFVCPLTKTIMRDPVTVESGWTYERIAIEKWFRECEENGRAVVCPMTGKELRTTTVKPSIALRHTIEEWTTRNEFARIENAKILLTSRISQQDILHGLKDVQVLCAKNKLNRRKLRIAGVISEIVNCLKHGEQVRCSALATLRCLAEGDNDNKEAIGETAAIRNCIKCLSRDVPKEREEAVSLLFELSKYQPLCEKIGAESGAILVLVGIVSSNSDDVTTVKKAEQTLENLEYGEQNVREMAVNGRLQPLLKRLIEGGEEVQVDMAMFLSELVLSREGKVKATAMGGKTLVDMLESGYLAGREAALKCLCQLSNLEANGKILAEAGILRPIIRDLFVVGVNQLPMKLKEVAATTLANIVNSGVDLEKVSIDSEGNTLISESTLHNLLHLVSNTGPAIEAKLLQVLVALASSSRASGPVIMSIKSSGATVSLIQFLEAPQKELRANSVKLLYRLCFHMGQEVADGLRIATGQLGTLVRLIGMSGVSEEQASAARLLANLPTEDTQLTQALLDEGALPTVVKQLDELRQGVSRLGAGRFVNDYKEGLVGILARFTYRLGDKEAVSLAQEYNLTAIFTNLLNMGLDEVQRLSSVALANLSAHSRELSVPPKVLPERCCCLVLVSKPPPKPTGLCVVHGGLCSAKETFCLLEARVVPSLVACLDHSNLGVVEASLKALLTLITDPQNLHGGVQVLNNADAIQPILDIMREHKTERLRLQAVTAVECMLRNEDTARTIATDGNVHTALVEAFKCGNNTTRHKAEKALQHLNKIPSISGVFQTRKF